MTDGDKSMETMDMDTAITHVAGLLGELEPDLSDNPEEEEQSEEPEDQDPADESDADDDDDQAADDDADVEEDDDGGEGDTDPDPWTVEREITVNGQRIKVTPEKALLDYQGQEASTRRFQEAAEIKKKFSEALEVTQAEQSRLVETLKVLEQALTPAEPNWDELRKDPARYEKERVAYLERKEQFRQFQEARKQSEQQAKETAKQARDSRLDEQRELLMTAIPEWVDSDRAAKESTEMVKYAMKSYGYLAEDFSEIDDHRAYVVLRKAWLYDTAKGKPGAATAKGGKPNSPSLKPGSKPPRGKGAKGAKAQQKALSRLKKSGSMDDAIEAVMFMIDD